MKKRIKEILRKLYGEALITGEDKRQVQHELYINQAFLSIINEFKNIVPKEKELPSSYFGIPDKISKDMGYNSVRQEILKALEEK